MSSKTYKILLGLFITVSALGLTWLFAAKIKIRLDQAKVAKAKEAVVVRRVAESNAVVAKVESRQRVVEAVNARTIDLSSHLNTSLTTSFVPKNVKDNNLSELKEGMQTLAGVPFNIKGSIQLTGRDLRQYSRESFPKEVTGIRIEASCNQLHILHGSSFIKQLGTTIAKLVLHYADGGTDEIPIISGKHVLDWWAPNYETGVQKDWRDVSASGSELAWVGSNPYIKRRQPHLSIRLFKSTFQNPHPSRQIATMDYVSADTAAAPFLLGLTVE